MVPSATMRPPLSSTNAVGNLFYRIHIMTAVENGFAFAFQHLQQFV